MQLYKILQFKSVAIVLILHNLDLKVGFQTTSFSGLTVDERIEEGNKHILYIRLITKTKSRVESFERRSSHRWLCSEEFYPTAVAANPTLFNDFIYFKVRDISSEGFKLQTSLRNKFLIPGMRFSCIMTFPMVAELNVDFEIKNVRVELINGRETLSVGATYDTEAPKLKKTIGQYLMQFSNVSNLEELRESGFDVVSVSDAVNFSFVRSKDEYHQVLKLRHIAYLKANKIPSHLTWEDMADSFDARSRIVIGKFKGRVVVSARLIFSNPDDTMELEQYLQIPPEFPRRDQIVEITRLCTSPDFRKSDLLISFFKFMAVAVAQSKREYVVTGAAPDMWPLYKRLGFTKSEIKYTHAKLGGIEHSVIFGKVQDGLEGRVTDPITWNIVWSDAVTYLDQYGHMENQGLTALRLTIYRWFAPIAKILYNVSKQRMLHKQNNSVSVLQVNGDLPSKFQNDSSTENAS
jgi:hypothetical protein